MLFPWMRSPEIGQCIAKFLSKTFLPITFPPALSTGAAYITESWPGLGNQSQGKKIFSPNLV